jgi:hypothetical protein
MYTYLATAIVAAALAFAGAWRVQEWRHDALDKERIEAANELRRERERGADNAAASHEAFKENERVVYKTITETVDKIVERPVYRNVCLDADGLRQLNAAITGRIAAPGELAPALPRPEPAQ